MASTSRPVVVGVDATTGGKRGVRYAALEAARLGLPLSVVHVSPGETAEHTSAHATEGTLRAYGIELLDGACAVAHDVAPDLHVESHLLPGGGVVDALVTCAEQAALLVLGAERRSFVHQVWTGDIMGGVAARARPPVTIVPAEWHPEPETGPVVVGVKDSERSGDLVGAGMSLADALGTELLLVHAWKAPSGYDDIIATRAYSQEYRALVTADLEPLVEAHRAAHPGVPVRFEVRHAQPAYAMIDASKRAERVLIARPRHGAAFHHLGGVGRALLRESRCPVEVHPESGG